MNIALITLEQAKTHLRIDDWDSAGAPDDLDLEAKILAASSAVLTYIGPDQPFFDSAGYPIVDSSGDAQLPAQILAAVCILLGDFYRNRDGENTAEWEYGFLPRSVQALLFPFRTPTLA